MFNRAIPVAALTFFLSIALFLPDLRAAGTIIKDVRAAIDHDDFARGSELIRAYRAANGATPEVIEAVSWMARGELAAKNLDAAEKYSQETYNLSKDALKKRPLDQDRVLPIALGAAIEVQANVFALRGERSGSVAYLQGELKKYYATSIRAR